MRLRVLGLVAALTLLLAAPAGAATWRTVTSPPGASTDQVGVLRTADGVLHVAWHRVTGPNSADLLHTAILPNGRVGATSPMQVGWLGFQDAALVPAPGGIRAFWGALRSTDPSDPQRELNTALSTDGGTTWALQPGSVVPPGGQAYAYDVSAAALPDGTPLQTWAGSLGTWVHAGLSPTSPNHDFQQPHGQYGYQPGIAADSAGAAMLAWFSSGSQRSGVLAQPVGPGGAPAGDVETFPGTAGMTSGPTSARTQIAARAGGGFYVIAGVGSPTPSQVRVWRVPGTGARLVGRSRGGAPAVAIAPDADGRLWAVWSAGPFGRRRVLARRSNRTATVWGATVRAGAVRRTHTVNSLDASPTNTALDILASFSTGTSPDATTSVARVRPGLSLAAEPNSLGRRPRTVRFRVTDAGDPVAGATVRAQGRSATTNSRGRATLRLARRATVRASKTNYTSARRRLR